MRMQKIKMNCYLEILTTNIFQNQRKKMLLKYKKL